MLLISSTLFFKIKHYKAMQKQKQKKGPPTIPLLELLAYNSTVSASNMLKKHNLPPATGYTDLQYKLKEIYDNSKDPLEVEKDFASIHPHREFILKYLSPPPVETKVIIPESSSSADAKYDRVSSKDSGFSVDEQLKIIKSNNVLIASIAIVGIVGLVIYMSKK